MEGSVRDYTDVTDKSFDIPAYMAKLVHPGCGGTSVFIGSSRCSSIASEREVVALEYQAYLPMARKNLTSICEGLRTRFPVGVIVLVHRVGYVPVGEPGLFVGVSAAHRTEAIGCMDAAIFTIKAELPVWKEEVFDDGSRSWTDNRECCWSPRHKEPANPTL